MGGCGFAVPAHHIFRLKLPYSYVASYISFEFCASSKIRSGSLVYCVFFSVFSLRHEEKKRKITFFLLFFSIFCLFIF